jgi:acyl-CoA synthetase (AMP-forming)/AMP-acid ligase II
MRQMVLTAWMSEPRRDEGVHWLAADGWSHVTYSQLAARAAFAAEQLTERGIEAGDVVATVDERAPEVLVSFLRPCWSARGLWYSPNPRRCASPSAATWPAPRRLLTSRRC